MTTIRIKIPSIKEVDFTIEALEDYSSVRGNACATGNDEEDKEEEDRILAALEYNQWAWCCVKVTATWKGIEGADYLGCCSYESKKDFIENSGYYEDMREQAYSELRGKIEGLRN